MLEVGEATDDAATRFDDPVDGLCPAAAGAVGVEVGQESGLPAAQGLARPSDLGDRAGRQSGDESLGEAPVLGGMGWSNTSRSSWALWYAISIAW